MPPNKYLDVYKRQRIITGPLSTPADAEAIIRQLGEMYNAMGDVIKDFIKVVKPKTPTREAEVQYQEQVL